MLSYLCAANGGRCVHCTHVITFESAELRRATIAPVVNPCCWCAAARFPPPARRAARRPAAAHARPRAASQRAVLASVAALGRCVRGTLEEDSDSHDGAHAHRSWTCCNNPRCCNSRGWGTSDAAAAHRRPRRVPADAWDVFVTGSGATEAARLRLLAKEKYTSPQMMVMLR